MCGLLRRMGLPIITRMVDEIRVKKMILFAVGIAAFRLMLPAQAEQSSPNAAPALTNWQAATSRFKQAGDFIGEDKYALAKAELSAGTTNLALPYRTMASQFLAQLDSALQLSTNRNEPHRLQALIELCSDLRAHQAALQLQTPQGSKTPSEDSADDALYAWRLLESGDTKAALAEYQRRFAKELVEIWQSYYQEQIRLIQQRATNLSSPQFAIDLVKEHYLKGLETRADLFGALSELTRVLPLAKEPKQAVAVYQLILKCLTGLGDDEGRDAWQERLLAEHKSDPEVCARVYVSKGTQAYYRKNLKEAEALFQKVCSEYPDSSAWGDGEYGLGLVLQEQQKYDEAMVQYAKIFPSKVNEDVIDAESGEDYPNYRFKAALRISECYEAKKDGTKALEYALLARDRYKFVSYCKDCLRETRQNVENRVKKLQEAVKRTD